jgi:hypothetical protein
MLPGHHLAEPPAQPRPVGQPGERIDAVAPVQLGGQAGATQCRCHLGGEAVERVACLGRDRPPPGHHHGAPAAVRGRQRRQQGRLAAVARRLGRSPSREVSRASATSAAVAIRPSSGNTLSMSAAARWAEVAAQPVVADPSASDQV